MINLHNFASAKWNKSVYVLMNTPSEWTPKRNLDTDLIVAISVCEQAKY